MSIDNFLTGVQKSFAQFSLGSEIWKFFEASDIREFRLESSKRIVTGFFHPVEIERAQTEMNAIIKKVNLINYKFLSVDPETTCLILVEAACGWTQAAMVFKNPLLFIS